jgi:hypothetical protein
MAGLDPATHHLKRVDRAHAREMGGRLKGGHDKPN